MNKKIKIKLPADVFKQYDIVIGESVLSVLVNFIKKQIVSNVVILTDSNVKKLYGGKLLCDLKKFLITYHLSPITFPAGEKSKNQKTKTKLEEKMIELGCGRDTLIIALGGGVVGDMAGFVAATYMRGVPYINIPTTLLSMMDSSVGGKTAIDTDYGKNMIGVFHQPSLVLINPGVLNTLSERQIKNGLVEAIKMFLTSDKQMFGFVENNLSDILGLKKDAVEKVIGRVIMIKSEIVMRDEKEKGERAILNFGHTVGHVIEKLSGYKLLHGEAIALGILVEAKIAVLVGKLSEDIYGEIEELLAGLVNIERLQDYKIGDILREVVLDKKTRGGVARYVLLKDIGVVCKQHGQYTHIVQDKIIKQALKYFV